MTRPVLAFSRLPLAAPYALALVVLIGGTVAIAMALVGAGPTVGHTAWIVAAVLFSGAAQLVLRGVLREYVGRTHPEGIEAISRWSSAANTTGQQATTHPPTPKGVVRQEQNVRKAFCPTIAKF